MRTCSNPARPPLRWCSPTNTVPRSTWSPCVVAALDGTVIVGISPDKPAAQQRFDDKFSLGYDLLADTDHAVAEAFGVWQEKALYGKKYMGIVRSAFLIDAQGTIEQAWYKISPADTPKKLLEALGR